MRRFCGTSAKQEVLWQRASSVARTRHWLAPGKRPWAAWTSKASSSQDAADDAEAEQRCQPKRRAVEKLKVKKPTEDLAGTAMSARAVGLAAISWGHNDAMRLAMAHFFDLAQGVYRQEGPAGCTSARQRGVRASTAASSWAVPSLAYATTIGLNPREVSQRNEKKSRKESTSLVFCINSCKCCMQMSGS